MGNFRKYGSMKGVLFTSLVLLCVLGLYMSMNLFNESFAETSIGETASYYKYQKRYKSGYKFKYLKPGRTSKSSKSDIGFMQINLDGSSSNTMNVYCALRGKTLSTKVKYYRYNFEQFYASKSSEWRKKLSNIVMLYPPGSSVDSLKSYLATNYPTEYANGGLANLTKEEASAVFQTAVWVFTNGDSQYEADTGNSARNKRLNTLHNILLQSNGYLKNISSNISSINFTLNSDLTLNQTSGKYEASLKTATSGFSQSADRVTLALSTNKGTVIDSSNYTINYSTSGSNTILNIVFNDGVFAVNADGKVILASNSEVFDGIYITANVSHGVTNKTVFVYKTSSSSYQNLVGVETVPVTSVSHINVTAPAPVVSKISLEIDKIDENNTSGYSLTDAYLHLYRVDGGASVLIDEWLTGDDKKVINDLQPGTYKIVETLYPEGYENSTSATRIDGENVYVASGKEFTLTADHTKFYVHVLNKQTEVKLAKVDSSGSNYVEGAVFSIIDSEGGEYYQFTSTSDNVSIKNELDVGTYFLIELQAPTNYVKTERAYRFTVGTPDADAETTITEGDYASYPIVDATYNSSTKVITVENQEGLSISKKSIDNDAVYVIGATLVITDSDGNEIDKWVTTAEDHIVTAEMPDGIYTLIETIPGPGYATAESIEFEIVSGKVINNVDINMKDAPLNVCIDKKAANVEGNLAGAEFELYNESNELVTKFTTTTERYCFPAVEIGLTHGKYTLKETKAPKGYRASSDTEIIINDTADLQAYEVVNEVEVPITSLNASSVIYIAIMVMGITGIGLVCYYVKKYSY